MKEKIDGIVFGLTIVMILTLSCSSLIAPASASDWSYYYEKGDTGWEGKDVDLADPYIIANGDDFDVHFADSITYGSHGGAVGAAGQNFEMKKIKDSGHVMRAVEDRDYKKIENAKDWVSGVYNHDWKIDKHQWKSKYTGSQGNGIYYYKDVFTFNSRHVVKYFGFPVHQDTFQQTYVCKFTYTGNG